jgi:pyruvate/2-oxoglutarate dehydrogenase complex dihydrolipoamide acyltransferase (E2) component
MRRRLGATTLVAAALLLSSVAVPAQADEVFHPEDSAVAADDAPAKKPADKKESKPAPLPAGDQDSADQAADPIPVPEGPPASEDSADRQERELAFARGSRMAADLSGYLPSLYTGKWYMPGKEDVRRCIMKRESHANYRSSNGVYHGAYQMSTALGRGATWMMQAEVKREMGDEGVAIVKALRKLTPNKWNRYWQDRAFWTIWRNGAGSKHWRGGAHSC